MKVQYRFSAKPWQYSGTGGWIFITLPQKLAKEIREAFRPEEEGWGRLKVTAQVGKTEWQTAIWFDTKVNSYLLPLKAEVRKKENLIIDKTVKVVVSV